MSFKLTVVTGYTGVGEGLWIRRVKNPAMMRDEYGNYPTRREYIEATRMALAGGSKELTTLDGLLKRRHHYGGPGCVQCACGKHHTDWIVDDDCPAREPRWTAIVRAEYRRWGRTKIDYTDPHVPLDEVEKLTAAYRRYVVINLPDAQTAAKAISAQLAELYRLAVVGAEIAENQRLADERARVVTDLGNEGIDAMLAASAGYVETVRAAQERLRSAVAAGNSGALPAGASVAR